MTSFNFRNGKGVPKMMKWGLIPHWARPSTRAQRNLRIEWQRASVL
jgi:hypothetical protein